jgi:diguanylate cyclase (GGDEF)-like protein/PAS domain S-box-containing protein
MIGQRSQSRTIRNIKLGFGALTLLLGLFVLFFTLRSWQVQKSYVYIYLTTTAELGKRSLNYYFSRLEFTLELLSQDLLAEDVENHLDQGYVLLKRFKREHPDLVNMNLLRPDGQILISTEKGYAKDLPFVGNIPSFAQAREEILKGQSLSIGRTLLGPVAQQWVIPLRYGVRDSAGRLVYILAAVLPLSTQQEFWENIPLPPNALLQLQRDDGYLVSRFPVPDIQDFKTLYGTAQNGYLAKALKAADFAANGIAEGVDPLSKKEFMAVYNRLDRHPLTFSISIPVENPLGRWWNQVKPLYLFVVILFGGVLLVYLWMVRRQRATEQESELAEQQLTLAANAMENTIEGIMISDSENRIVSVNKAFSDITGYSREEVIGNQPTFLHSGHHNQVFYAEMWKSLHQHGRWEGEITNRRKNGELYTELLSISVIKSEDGAISHFVGVFNDISQSKHYEERLEFLAHHDPLTNLPNRFLLHDRLEEAIVRAQRSESLVFVLFMDLDRFKVINDSLGHDMGDRLLQLVATRLQTAIRDTDTVARLGGDEFTIILEQMHNTEDTAIVAQKLLDSLVTPVVIGDHQLFTSASIGISCFPRDGHDVATLLKHADTALYRAKEERNKFKFFSSVMNIQAQEFMAMANSLHGALENNQIYLDYQPRINLVTGCISGVEALARWRHPVLGLVPPDKFIPLAEETGLIVAIGDWILREACNQGRRWQEAGYPLRVGVNLSTRQFRKQQFASEFLAIVAETGFDRELLEVEITESLMMHDPDSTKRILDELATHNVRIAIDDFGTGYSSLYYLRSFPIHYLKIDRSFMHDVPNNANNTEIVRTIISMAKNLRLALIAEGVETVDQLAMLMAESCEEVQGFLLSQPVAASEIPALVQRYAADDSGILSAITMAKRNG